MMQPIKSRKWKMGCLKLLSFETEDCRYLWAKNTDFFYEFADPNKIQLEFDIA